MQQSLIVGFGRAGQGLHLPCLRKACTHYSDLDLFDPLIGVVDPHVSAPPQSDQQIKWFPHLDHVQDFDPSTTVVHICTPPDLHESTLQAVAEHGYKKIIMEKPLTTTMDKLEHIRFMNGQHGLDLLVIANWLSSTLTSYLLDMIRSGIYGAPIHIAAEQNKARLAKSLRETKQSSAFDIEIPHLVALALYLGGTDAEVLTADAQPMITPERTIPHMGYARMTLLHHDTGITSELYSNLATPIRKRVVRITFKHHTVVGYFPCAQDDSYSWVKVYDSNGWLIDTQVFYDDPLSAVFFEFYHYYDGQSRKPISDLAFNSHVVTSICRAKALCGLNFTEVHLEEGVFS